MRRFSIYSFVLLLLFLTGFCLFFAFQKNFDEKPFSFSSFLNIEQWMKEPLMGSETILLMGKQGDNVDTLMLARVHTSTSQVRLVSIPRDLYVDGLKINAYAFSRSLESQLQVIEKVSGMQVDHYVLVDLEAFRSIVDLLGGIDIVLEKELVDPTYKVCDEEGLCSTLNYPAGAYHLNGTEALRVARSRHSTSDYDRAARQQLIVEALKLKLQDLQNQDLGVLLKLVSTVRDFKVESKGVLSTANVLSSVAVPVNYVTSFQQELCENKEGIESCHPQYYIYTLAPLNGDWSQISSWIRQALEATE
jgi:LCP family protein required for cell wall assembly